MASCYKGLFAGSWCLYSKNTQKMRAEYDENETTPQTPTKMRQPQTVGNETTLNFAKNGTTSNFDENETTPNSEENETT